MDTHVTPAKEFKQYRRYYQAIAELQKKPRTHIYTTVALTFLTVSLFGWYAIRPTIQTILYLRREITDKTEVNKKMEDKIAALISAQAAYEDVEDNVSVLDDALPPTPNAIDLLRQLRSLTQNDQASISAVHMSDVSVTGQASSSSNKKQTTGSAAELPLTVTITGSYPQLITVLRDMIQMRRIMTIDSIAITPNTIQKEREQLGALQMNVRLRSYYLPEPSYGTKN